MLELAREADWEAIHRLSLQVHDLHTGWRPDIYCHCDEPYPREAFLEDIARRQVYVAKLGDTVAGYVTVSILRKEEPGLVSKKVMALTSLCVDEPFRRQGIGMAIVADIRVLAKAFRCQELRLGVYPENDSAVAFYQKCGFMIRAIQMDMQL